MIISRRSFIQAGAVCTLCTAVPSGGIVFGQQGSSADAHSPRPPGYPAPYQATLYPLYYMDKSTFDPHLNTEFRFRGADGNWVTLRLVEVSDLERDPKQRENPRWGKRGFSLLFKGSRERLLPQRAYEVEHGALGEFTLFLVPVFSTDKKNYNYEAIFNRL